MGRVLVVDDEPEVREVVSIFLRKKGYDIDKCETGEDALDALERNGIYDVVIMDNRMPGLRGQEVLSRMREKGMTTPVILLTGSIGTEERSTEADKFLRKPIDLNELFNDVKELSAADDRQAGE
jgi:CheY-like chemotaxis protein